MDLGALELQVFVSLTVILGAAFVALVCDYLKGHNEQLREQNIELRSRRDEQERLAVLDPVRWLESFGDRTAQATEQTTHEVLDRWPPPRPVLVAADGVRAEFTQVDKKETYPAVIVPEVVEEPVRFQHRSEPELDDRWRVPPPPPREILSLEEIQDAIQSRPNARPEVEEKPVASSRKKSGLDIGDELKQMIKRSFGRGRPPAKPVESMSADVNEPGATEPTTEQETLPERTTESIELLDRIVGRPSSQPTPEPVPAVVVTESQPSAESISTTPEVVARVEFSAEPPLNPQPSVSFIPAPPEESATEAVTPIRPLLASQEQVAEPEQETPPAPPVEPLMEALGQNNDAPINAPAATAVPPEAAIPAGFQEAKVLAGLIDSGVQVNGVVFALGITDYKRVQETQGQQALDELVNAVRVMIVDIVGENDFAARAAEDSFVLVFKNESGAAAQRRINQVSERLWDFQLRSLGVSSILFSWGAVEVKEETLKNAIAAANERLEQSRRNRKGSPGSTKRVVNG